MIVELGLVQSMEAVVSQELEKNDLIVERTMQIQNTRCTLEQIVGHC